MKPIQILEEIKEDIRDKFDGDPLMMRTMNLVITEYKARSERLHKPVVVRGGDKKLHPIPHAVDVNEASKLFMQNNSPTEPLPAEGQGEANTCAGGSKCVDIEIDEGYYQCEKCGMTSRA